MDKQIARIKEHYGLRRWPTAIEVEAEIANLKRKAANGSLDYRQELLYAALDLGRAVDREHGK